jgi:hypothetical protein
MAWVADVTVAGVGEVGLRGAENVRKYFSREAVAQLVVERLRQITAKIVDKQS